jgi:tRNA (guanosine-2'-O-)-methyltransferase
VAHIDEAAVPVSDVDFTTPSAVVFGNELRGVSEAMLAEADLTCVLPTPGFVQSYNISVAAAMTLHHAWNQRARKTGANGDLSAEEKQRLRADFYIRAASGAEAILRRAFGDPGAGNDA